MGKKRKGKKVTVQKRIYKIPKLFPCAFCGKKDGIKITLDHKRRVAELVCRSCGVGDKGMKIGPLTEPIDIYTEWMDQSRQANARYNRRQAPPEEERDRGSDYNDDSDIIASDDDDDPVKRDIESDKLSTSSSDLSDD